MNLNRPSHTYLQTKHQKLHINNIFDKIKALVKQRARFVIRKTIMCCPCKLVKLID